MYKILHGELAVVLPHIIDCLWGAEALFAQQLWDRQPRDRQSHDILEQLREETEYLSRTPHLVWDWLHVSYHWSEG